MALNKLAKLVEPAGGVDLSFLLNFVIDPHEKRSHTAHLNVNSFISFPRYYNHITKYLSHALELISLIADTCERSKQWKKTVSCFRVLSYISRVCNYT